jgi:hypothetical protein
MRCPRIAWGLPLTVLLVLRPQPLLAQVVDVPTFVVATRTVAQHMQGPLVAASSDGTMVFSWGEYTLSGPGINAAMTRWFSPQGVPLGVPRRVDSVAFGPATPGLSFPMICSDTRGGYVATWEWVVNGVHQYIVGRRLDGTGAGVGSEFEINAAQGGGAWDHRVAGLPSGSVFMWFQNGLWRRLYDQSGRARGAALDSGYFPHLTDVIALSDGGFVAVVTDFPDLRTSALFFGADGQQRGNALPLTDRFRATGVKTNPRGGFGIFGVSTFSDDQVSNSGYSHRLWARRFADDGTPLGPEVMVYEADAENLYLQGNLEFDALGNLYTAWGQFDVDTRLAAPLKARVFNTDGDPFGDPVTISEDDKPAAGVGTARLADGRIVNTWAFGGAANYTSELWANIVRVCPSDSGCGRGTPVTPLPTPTSTPLPTSTPTSAVPNRQHRSRPARQRRRGR